MARTLIFAGLFSVLLGWEVAAELPGAHRLVVERELPFHVEHFAYLSEGGLIAIAASEGENSATVLSYMSAEGHTLGNVHRLPYKAISMAPDDQGEGVYLVGEVDSEVFLTHVPNAGEARTAKLPGAGSFLGIEVGRSGKVYIYDRQSSLVIIVPKEVFLSDEVALNPVGVGSIRELRIPSVRGVSDFAVSEDHGIAIIAEGDNTEAQVVNLADGSPVASFGYAGSGVSAQIPYAIASSRIERSKKISLLFADHRLTMLTLLEFDPHFQEIFPINIANMRHPLLPGTMLETVGTSHLLRQPILIAGSADLDVVIVANSYSNHVFQYSAHDARSLEKITTVVLPGRPAALSVSNDGRRAALSIHGTNTVVLLSNDDSAPSSAVGDLKVRELQRRLNDVGLPVGAVDGIYGPATARALGVVRSTTGRTFDLNDIDSAIDAANSYEEKIRQ